MRIVEVSEGFGEEFTTLDGKRNCSATVEDKSFGVLFGAGHLEAAGGPEQEGKKGRSLISWKQKEQRTKTTQNKTMQHTSIQTYNAYLFTHNHKSMFNVRWPLWVGHFFRCHLADDKDSCDFFYANFCSNNINVMTQCLVPHK